MVQNIISWDMWNAKYHFWIIPTLKRKDYMEGKLKGEDANKLAL